MVSAPVQSSGSFDWLQLEAPYSPARQELAMDSLLVMELNGRYLYLKAVQDLQQFEAIERRTLESLARHGDTVLLAVGEPRPNQLSYRLPDTENAVALGPDGLRGIIQQWCVWAINADQ